MSITSEITPAEFCTALDRLIEAGLVEIFVDNSMCRVATMFPHALTTCVTVTQYTRQLSSCLYLLPALLQNGLRLTMPKVLVPASASPPTVLELLALGISPRNPAAMTMTYRNMQKAEYKAEQIRAIVISMIEYGAPLPEWMKVRDA